MDRMYAQAKAAVASAIILGHQGLQEFGIKFLSDRARTNGEELSVYSPLCLRVKVGWNARSSVVPQGIRGHRARRGPGNIRADRREDKWASFVHISSI